MVAHIQLPNVDFFSRLGWSTVGGTETYAGRPHQQMHIALPDPDRGRSSSRSWRAKGELHVPWARVTGRGLSPWSRRGRAPSTVPRPTAAPALTRVVDRLTTSASSPRHECAEALRLTPRRRAEQEAVRREAGEPVDRAPRPGGQDVEIQRHAHPAPLEEHRQGPDETGHADVLRRRRHPNVLRQQPHVTGEPVSALVEGAEERKSRDASCRPQQARTSDHSRATSRRGSRRLSRPEGRQRRGSADREVSADQGHVVHRATVLQAAQRLARDAAVPTIVSTMPRRGTHGREVVDVRQHGRDTRAVRIRGEGREERPPRGDDLAGDASAHAGLLPCRRRRRRRPVPGPSCRPSTGETREISPLARSRGVHAQEVGQLLERAAGVRRLVRRRGHPSCLPPRVRLALHALSESVWIESSAT